MPIQVNPPEKKSVTSAVVLGVLVFLGLVLVVNWRALILVLILMAAAAGWYLHG